MFIQQKHQYHREYSLYLDNSNFVTLIHYEN